MSKIKSSIFDARFDFAVTSVAKVPEWRDPGIEGKRWKLVAIVQNKSTTCVCGASIDKEFCIFQRSDGSILAPVGTDCARHLGYTEWHELSLVYGVDVSGIKSNWLICPAWFETDVGRAWVTSVRRKCLVCDQYLWTRAAIREHIESDDHARIAMGFRRRACVSCGELLSVDDTETPYKTRCLPCHLYTEDDTKKAADSAQREAKAEARAEARAKTAAPKEKRAKVEKEGDGECELE